MSARDRLRFGAGGAVGGLSAGETLDLAQSADELGYDLFTLSDHLHGGRPSLEPLTALSWIAARTRTIEVGTNVLGLPYREPPSWPRPPRRSTGCRAGGSSSASEAAVSTTSSPRSGSPGAARARRSRRCGRRSGSSAGCGRGAGLVPRRPLHGPRRGHHPGRPAAIPIWLGSYGPRSLALTGELADGWLPSLGRISLAQAAAMRRAVRRAARDAGRDPGSITCACNVRVLVDPSRSPTPELVTGGVDAVVDQLTGIVAAGFTSLLLALPTMREQEFFAREIIPQVRERAANLDPGLADADTASGQGRTA